MSDDPFHLQRFVDAQHPVFDRVLAELARGEKTSHWMWFVFPQIAGLGSSAMARRYAITGAAEARAYGAHPVLGPRLTVCCEALLRLHDRTARQVFGDLDARKLHSSLTPFAAAIPDAALFGRLLARYSDGAPDPATLERL